MASRWAIHPTVTVVRSRDLSVSATSHHNYSPVRLGVPINHRPVRPRTAAFGSGRAASTPASTLSPIAVCHAVCPVRPVPATSLGTFKYVKRTSRAGEVDLPARNHQSLRPALPGCTVCSHRNCDESTQHIQLGRPASPRSGRRSLVTVSVAAVRRVCAARHVAVAVLARARCACAVSARVALVAAVRLALARRHRLVAAITPAAAPGLSRRACQKSAHLI